MNLKNISSKIIRESIIELPYFFNLYNNVILLSKDFPELTSLENSILNDIYIRNDSIFLENNFHTNFIFIGIEFIKKFNSVNEIILIFSYLKFLKSSKNFKFMPMLLCSFSDYKKEFKKINKLNLNDLNEIYLNFK